MTMAYRKIDSSKYLSAIFIWLFLLTLSSNAQQAPLGQAAKDAQAAAENLGEVKALPQCSLAKTNTDCKLIVDRQNPVAAPTIQMYSNQTLFVIVRNPNPFERYFLDYQTGQAALTPDVASSIVQGLLPSLQKVGEFHGFDFIVAAKTPADKCAVDEITDTDIPDAGTVSGLIQPVGDCIAQIALRAISIYQELEAYVAPDAAVPTGGLGPTKTLNQISSDISPVIAAEVAVSARISAISGDQGLKTTADLDDRAKDARAILELIDLQKLADALATDLIGYSSRIKDLADYTNGYRDQFRDCSYLMDDPAVPPRKCIWIKSRKDDDQIYQGMTTRTITYSLNLLNLVGNPQEAVPDPSKKKTLATVTINFAETAPRTTGAVHSALRWEASAGVFFSTLAIRSFAVAPVFTKASITDKTVSQNILHPTAVPFAAANYRLTNDLPGTRWKSNIYWTGAVGINPNTVSADFATGLSYSWRALMVSALAHFGHDTRLTQGLKVGESLGAGFNGSLPTQTYWTTSFAIGLSVRVPSLTGR
jgi:hypothetical protein